MMSSYPVLCYTRGCGRPAVYKIAARWSDGITEELKTYSLCCAECLAHSFHSSQQRQGTCRRAPGEILEPPGIYQLVHGQRDRHLVRCTALEQELTPQAI